MSWVPSVMISGKSWVPDQDINGILIPHGEAFTIPQFLHDK